jgi:hypothetical protein
MLLLQEGSTVSWDPGCPQSSHGIESLLALPLFAVALYVNWRHLKWLSARLANRRGWRATRYWFPTMMVAATMAVIWAALGGCGDDTAATLVLFFNWPAWIGAIVAGVLMAGAGATNTTAFAAAIGAGAWAGWYALIRWAETRPNNDLMVRLNLT